MCFADGAHLSGVEMWLFVLACSMRSEAPAPVSESVPISEPAAPASWSEPAAPTHLALSGHDSTLPTVRLGAVRLTDGQHSSLGEAPALPRPRQADRFETVTAADGAAVLVAVPDGEGYALLLRGLDGSERRLPVGTRRPASLMLLPDQALIGAENTVASLDLRAPDPAVEVLLTREEMYGKAYDRFSRDGDWLIAVDDVVMPIYADLFRLSAGGTPVHLAGLTLPGVINGTYDRVHLSRTGPADGTLFAVTPYSVMDGHGHSLAALPIKDNALSAAEDGMVLNSSPGGRTGPAIIEEHVSRRDGAQTLWAGTDYTALTGLDRLGDQLLLAAGERGLLVVPADFVPGAAISTVDVGGSALDVAVVGERAWVLVGADSGGLQAVEADLSLGVRHPLPQGYTQILD